MQIKTTIRLSLHTSQNGSSKNPQTINAGEGVEKTEPFFTVGRNVLINWYSHNGEQHRGSLIN